MRGQHCHTGAYTGTQHLYDLHYVPWVMYRWPLHVVMLHCRHAAPCLTAVVRDCVGLLHWMSIGCTVVQGSKQQVHGFEDGCVEKADG